MSEWKLWDGDKPPVFTTPGFFVSHPHIPGGHQVGYYERVELVMDMLENVHQMYGNIETLGALCDLGCGDGTLLQRAQARWPRVKMWGYDLGRGNVRIAQERGLDVQQRDILDDDLFVAPITLVTEVLEHLEDPHRFLRTLRSQYLVATSPARETDQWHYEHHAWAWDEEGFETMIKNAGWNIKSTSGTVAKDRVTFGPVAEHKEPWFQCVFARRNDRS